MMKQMQEQKNVFPTEKKRRFQEPQGESGRELGSDCAAETKRELAGCVWEARVPTGGRDSAGRGWPAAGLAACLPLTEGNLGIAPCKPLFWVRADQEKNKVVALAMSGHILLSHPVCEALSKSLDPRSLVHEEGIMMLVPTTSQEC